MDDTSATQPGERPGTPRQRGPRHAAPEGPPALPSEAPPQRATQEPAGSRAAHRRPRVSGGRPTVRHRGRWLAAGAALVAVVTVVVIGLVRDDGDDPSPDTAGAAAPGPPAPLVDWLRTELPPGGTVTAPPELRAALLAAGAEADALPESPPEVSDPAIPSLALVETPPDGSRLLARFGRAGGAGPLLLVDPAPVEPTDEQLRQRRTLAAAVLANPTTRAEDDARAVLDAADVDARLLALVAALTAQDGVGLYDFPVLPGEEPGGAPARRVVVDAVGGRPVPADGAATQRLVAWLDAQLAPFAPDTVEVTGDGVLIGFDYVPGPDAVVSAATP